MHDAIVSELAEREEYIVDTTTDENYESMWEGSENMSIGQQMARDGITYSPEKEKELIGLMSQYMKKAGMSSKEIRYYLSYDEDFIPDQLSDLPKEGRDDFDDPDNPKNWGGDHNDQAAWDDRHKEEVEMEGDQDWMADMRAMAHKMAPQDKMRERQAERDAQAKAERQQKIQQDIENLPDLISQYNDMETEYESMGGSNWQYADNEQNLSDEERRARNMETSMRQLADRIHTAKTAKNKGLAEGDSGAKYKVRSIGHDAKGDYYISPSTGKKVYKKGVKVGDHENPKTGEHKGVAENKADGINKMFNNLGDPVYANLQRVALLAMQGRQQEASGRLQTVIKDADPDVQKKITDAVNNIKPVTINGKIADSSRLDKSKQHNDWIINTFIPWVQSLLGKQGVAEGGPKGYDSDGNPLGGGYDEYENNWVVTIDGKTWKTFDDERQAYKAAAAIERKYGKKTRVYKN